MTNSLNLRVNLIVFAVTSFLIICLGVYDFNVERYRAISSLKNRVQNDSNKLSVILPTIVWNMDSDLLKDAFIAVMSESHITSVAFIERGEILLCLERDENWKVVESNEIYHKELSNFVVTKKIMLDDIQLGILRITSTNRFLEKELTEKLASWILKMAIITFILVVLLLAIIKKIIIIPIIQITNEFKKVEKGDYSSSFDLDRSDELGDMGRGFLYMRNVINNKIAELEDEKEKGLMLQDYLSNIINSIPSILIGIDNQGVVTQWNSSAIKESGVDLKNAIGCRFDKLLPHITCEFDGIMSAVGNKHNYTIPAHTYYKNGEKRIDSIAVFPLFCGEDDGAVIRIDDITDQLKLQEIVAQGEKMRSVAGLAAGMAHEINNPLAGIIQGYQNIIRRIDPESESNLDCAKKFNLNLNDVSSYLNERKVLLFIEGGRKSCLRAAEIVKNMLLFSRKSSSDMCPVNIVDIVEKAIKLGASDYDMKKKYDFKFVEIIRDYDDKLPLLNCVESEIEQVLLNLFKNAIQAMEETDDVEFKPRFIIRIKKENEFIRLEVEDNGSGMSKAVSKCIFEPFYTTKAPGMGTGLGLSVSFAIITQNHAGTFEVDSELGVGTKFTIRLPIIT